MDSLIQKARQLVERKRELIRKNAELFLEQGINYIGDKECHEEYEKERNALAKEARQIGCELIRMTKEAEEVLKILKVDFMLMVEIEGKKASEEIKKAIIEKAAKKPEKKAFLN